MPSAEASPRLMGEAENGPRMVVAMLGVANVTRSAAFYQQLGFELANTFENDQELCWAWMQRGSANLMLTKREAADRIRNASVYVYVADVAAYRENLIGRGISVSGLEYPFWSPRGEFAVIDPDGWTLHFAHVDE